MRKTGLHIVTSFKLSLIARNLGIVLISLALSNNGLGQTVIYSTGFETSDLVGAAMPVWDVNLATTTLTGTDGNCVRSTYSADWGLLSGTVDGVLSFYITTTVGKYYTVEVLGTEGPNKATIPVMIKTAAAGDRTTMAAGTTLATWSVLKINGCSADLSRWFKGTGAWEETTGGTLYVGFYFNQSFAGGTNNSRIHYDNIVVTEYDDRPCALYCTVDGDLATAGEVTNVIFNTINNTTAFDGYVCTGVGTAIQIGTAYDLKVTRLNNGTYNLRTAAWIDWNNNGVFTDAGEDVMPNLNDNTGGSVQRIINFTVPPGAAIGTTKMRVVMKYNSDLTGPCDAYTTYIDWEDYDITVEAGAPSAPTLYNTGGATQLAFNNSYINDNTPLFRASAVMSGGFDRFFIEINALADFTGTAYTQIFSGAYATATQYDLDCNSLSTALPTTNGVTYYVRAKASDDAGATWGNWSSGTYSFTYKISGNADWFQTTTDQFNSDVTTGCSVSANSVTKSSGGTFYIDDDMEYADDAAFEADWTVAEGTGCSADPSTVQAVSGTKSILITDASSGGGGKQVKITKTWATQNIVTVEFDIYLTDAVDEFQFYGRVSPISGIQAVIDWYNGNVSYYSSGFTNFDTYTVNTWYHVKVYINSDADSYDIYIDDMGAAKISGVAFTNASTNVGQIDFNTVDPGVQNGVYIDDVKVYTGNPVGSITATSAKFASFDGAGGWVEANWIESGGIGDFKVTVQKNSSGWVDVAGMVDIDVSPIDLASLGTEPEIRLVGNFTYSGTTPSLDDWTITAGSSLGYHAYGVYAGDAIPVANVDNCEIYATGGTGGNGFTVSSNSADDGYGTGPIISGYPIIITEPYNCTGVNIDFSTTDGAPHAWDFGSGAAPPTSSVSPQNDVQYSTTVRKDITYDANIYKGFVNIIMAAPSPGTITGPTPGCPGTYNYASSEAGQPGYLYSWSVDPVGTDAPAPATATASSTDITYMNSSGTDNVYNVRLTITTECCGPLLEVVYPVTINSLPAAPGVLEAAPTKCIGGSKTIEVSPVTAGYNYNWYDASSGGTLQGSGPTLTISPVVDGPVSYWVEATSADGCISATRIEVALDGTNSPPTTDSPSQCAAGIQTITVTNPVVGATYNWYSDVGLTTNVQSGTAITYDLNVPTAPSSANVYVTVTETGCAASTGTTATATTTGGSVATITWIGVTSVDWFTASNWYPACIPGCTDIVRLDIEADGYATPPAFMPEIAWVGAGGGGVACAKDIRIQTGITLTMLAGDDKAVLEVNGDWKLCGTFAANSGMVKFIGSVAQSIEGSQTTTFNALAIENSSATGVTLNKPIIVTQSVAFSDGILFTDATNYITVNDGASSTNGSSSSFVDGPIKKKGSDAFVFPTGDGTKWARVAISVPTDPSTEYTAEYFASGYSSFAVDGGGLLNNVSQKEYWTLDQGGASPTNVQVKLYWEDSNFSGITECSGPPTTADLRVAHWNSGGPFWEENVAGVNLNGACPTNGWVQTSSPQTVYSPFTFASRSALVNPLPISLMYFTAFYNRNTKDVDLDWATSSEMNNDFFSVERSSNGTDFGLVVTVPGAGISNEMLYYEAIDTDPYTGVSYYRLKQTDQDKNHEYSDIVAVKVLQGLKFSIRPNPATDYLEITFGEIAYNTVFVMTPDYQAEIRVFDARGTLVYEKKFEGTFYKFNIDISAFDNGMYIVSLMANGDNYTAKFIKE
ncbi:MAG: T9SS type A sorting domain-containing protein [Flavobacteriales bacterium]|nr:T9SS type A sorting domain-containing protein [Flavobacteriales bacterium]